MLIALLIILGIIVYLAIGKVIANWIDYTDWFDKYEVNLFIIGFWPIAAIYKIAMFIGDLINGSD